MQEPKIAFYGDLVCRGPFDLLNPKWMPWNMIMQRIATNYYLHSAKLETMLKNICHFCMPQPIFWHVYLSILVLQAVFEYSCILCRKEIFYVDKYFSYYRNTKHLGYGIKYAQIWFDIFDKACFFFAKYSWFSFSL